MKFFSVAALLAAGTSSVSATFMGGKEVLVPPKLSGDFDMSVHSLGARAGNATSGAGTFQQLIDHSDPSLGTFSQRYWWSTEFWNGSGSPVIAFTPGEVAADDYGGYLTIYSLIGQVAKRTGAALILFEHRYWGESSPFANLTVKNLQYLTLNNSIHDNTYLARNIELPFDTTGGSNAPAAPWVLSGGSYSGALTGWTANLDPGTFWAYHASSAVVEAVEDFWTYFEPVREGMPQNCSLDVQRVISYVDHVLTTGSAEEIHELKDKFGLAALEHNDDFASALQNGPWLWQSHDFDSGYSSFFRFCDYVENSVKGEFNRTCKAGPNGVGLKRALEGYAKWFTTVELPGYCDSYTGYFEGELNIDCFNTYDVNSPIFTDLSVDNQGGRQWNWYLCNEPFNFWQDGAPEGKPTLVSRLVTAKYWERQCALFFPEEDGYTYGMAKGKTAADVNAFTGGWFGTDTTRLIWANGQYDPWKDSTVSSDYRPGGPLVSTPERPVNVIPGGIHCSDLSYSNALENAGLLAVVEDEIATLTRWVEEFYTEKTKRAVPFQA